MIKVVIFNGNKYLGAFYLKLLKVCKLTIQELLYRTREWSSTLTDDFFITEIIESAGMVFPKNYFLMALISLLPNSLGHE
jgi:hypothetical protein